ncbi:DUF2061 domain-containing protein [Lacinutrix sp. 5H-3-7-4]|uniref:DUF2061 domain-containing protein n=1 Tax=Lacinutrix sp. (strain 5H-3-7-4) TaxID=983544 RepID=UPI00020A3704|nr:DUF2061 domain-containing protein [Lacinutrix sp. 5H-3-7-4]AEH00317.1 Protein of unknown function DUF2061, membrane [Lacinutrix sp. 5H-3-7-4]
MILDLFYKAEKQKQTSSKNGEKVSRSLIKTISWRLIGTLDTIVISYLITGTLKMAFSIGMVELFTKMILYFFHERAWSKIKWGK